VTALNFGMCKTLTVANDNAYCRASPWRHLAGVSGGIFNDPYASREDLSLSCCMPLSGSALTFVICGLGTGQNLAPFRGLFFFINGVAVMRRHEFQVLCFWGVIFLASGAVLVSRLF